MLQGCKKWCMSPDSGNAPKVTKSRLIKIFRDSDKPILTTGEIIDQVPVTRPAVNPKLRDLVEEGELGARKASNTWFYWLPGRVVEDPAERIVGDELVLDVDDRHREELEKIAEEEDTTPEEAAKEVLADALKDDPFPYWDITRSLSFLVVLAAVSYGLAENYGPAVLADVLLPVTGILTVLFLGSFFVMAFSPIVDPAVDRAQEWLAERGEE